MYKYLSLILTCWLLSSCSIESSFVHKVRVKFSSGELELYGTLITPSNISGPYPVVVLVHGDGPMPFDAFGYYRPIWTEFAHRGIATFSWDKPGIGGSTGDWLQQSMDDRTENVKNAIIHLQKLEKTIDKNNIGVMGFSQAGWVLPKISKKKYNVDFAVLIGTAVNWQRQGDYHRNISEGKDSALSYQNLTDSLLTQAVKKGLTFDEYVKVYAATTAKKNSFKEELLNDEARYNFVAKNWQVDAEKDLSNINIPVLAVFGEDDLNVDIEDSIYYYKKAFTGEAALLTIKKLQGASHGLMHSWFWNTQNPSLPHILMIDLFGKHMFADNAIDEIATWIEKQKNE